MQALQDGGYLIITKNIAGNYCVPLPYTKKSRVRTRDIPFTILFVLLMLLGIFTIPY